MAEKNEKETEHEATIRLAASVSILMLSFKMKLDYTDPDIAKPLLYGLTVQSNGKTCPDFDALVNVHFRSQVEYVCLNYFLKILKVL